MSIVIGGDDLNHDTNVFIKDDYCHFKSKVSKANLFRKKITRRKKRSTLKLKYYELHHSIPQQGSKP